MTLSIRLATAADAGTIHRALLGIAEHVGETHRVTSTADDIRRHGFGESPAFRALIAEAGTAVSPGLCLFFPSFSTWKGRPGVYVQDLFVDPAYRGRRVGERLLKSVARLAREEGATYLRLSVDAKNHAGRAFYDRLGMKWADQEMIRAAYGADFLALAEDAAIGARTGDDR